MATSVIKNQKVFFGGFDLTGTANALAVEHGCDALENTVLNTDTHTFKSGLYNVSAGLEGFVDFATEDNLFGEMGADGHLISYSAAGTPGSVGYMFLATLGQYNASGAVGELLKYSLSAAAAGSLLRGKILGSFTGIDDDGASDPLELIAVPEGKKLYAGIHVLRADGDTPEITVRIESDATDDFSGAETVRLTFPALNAPGSALVDLGAEITDTHYRAAWEVNGDAAEFDFIIIIAIQ